ncbi:hypothetical protein DFP72DRAFT_642173 [Ephemerocybe angulata]|uniref:Uncharacterized protein n=1 Tax=Ephemerocybe angulata TaxID=980116 RepID=A0A8H6LVV7_9AGAR|nr:hypothetical protein DFP72DRAFT_642173 [Tulosesus angulatus]
MGRVAASTVSPLEEYRERCSRIQLSPRCAPPSPPPPPFPLPQLSLLSLGTTFGLWVSAIAGPRHPYCQHRSTGSLQGALTNKFHNIERSTTATSPTAHKPGLRGPAGPGHPLPRQRMNDGAGFDVGSTRCINSECPSFSSVGNATWEGEYDIDSE